MQSTYRNTRQTLGFQKKHCLEKGERMCFWLLAYIIFDKQDSHLFVQNVCQGRKLWNIKRHLSFIRVFYWQYFNICIYEIVCDLL